MANLTAEARTGTPVDFSGYAVISRSSNPLNPALVIDGETGKGEFVPQLPRGVSEFVARLIASLSTPSSRVPDIQDLDPENSDGVEMKSQIAVWSGSRFADRDQKHGRLNRATMPVLLAGTMVLAGCSGGKTPEPTVSTTASPSPYIPEGYQYVGPDETVIPKPTEPPTPPPDDDETHHSDDLYERFALDIHSSIPEFEVDDLIEELRVIENTLPNLPFVATETQSGLIPNVATADVIVEQGPVNINSPEGGVAYISWGGGKLDFDGHTFDFPFKENNVYLTFVIGNPDDTTAMDLNTTLTLSGYAAGHVFASQGVPRQGQEIPGRDVVNLEWFDQQLWWATLSGSNCGVGCEFSATVDFIDAFTGGQTRWILKITPQRAGFPALNWVRG